MLTSSLLIVPLVPLLLLQPGLLPSHVGKKQQFHISAKNKRGDAVSGVKFQISITELSLNKKVPKEITESGNGIYTVSEASQVFPFWIFSFFEVCVL